MTGLSALGRTSDPPAPGTASALAALGGPPSALGRTSDPPVPGTASALRAPAVSFPGRVIDVRPATGAAEGS
jgi:hypothetical protein